MCSRLKPYLADKIKEDLQEKDRAKGYRAAFRRCTHLFHYILCHAFSCIYQATKTL